MIPVVGSMISWNGCPWKVANVSPDRVSLLRDDLTVLELPRSGFEQLISERSITAVPGTGNSELLQRILKADEDELRRVNHRYDCVCRFLGGDMEGLSVPVRTLRRWASRYQEADRCFASGFLGLFSNTAKRGNSTSKLPEETAALMAEYINNDYETPKQKRKRTSWMALRLECQKRGITAPSYKT